MFGHVLCSMEVPTLTRSWSMTAVFEPSRAVRAVTVAKRREYKTNLRRKGVMGGEHEIPGELPTSFPITSSPAMPVLHMNSPGLEAIAIRLEAVTIRLGAIASGLEAIALGLEAIAIRWLLGWRPSLLGWMPLLLDWRPSLLGWSPYEVPFCVWSAGLFTIKKGHPQATQSLPAAFCSFSLSLSLSCPQRPASLQELAPHMGCG